MYNPAKKHFSYTIKDFYKRYRRREIEKGNRASDVIAYKHYRNIIEGMFAEIQRSIIYDRTVWVMPYSLGRTLVKAKKNANIRKSTKAIDFHLTKKHGKVIRHLNIHTNGYYFMFSWDKSYSRFRNRAYYTFSATTSPNATKVGIGKRGLSKHIIDLSKNPEKRSYVRI